MSKYDRHIPEWTIHTKAKNSVFAQDELWTIMDGEKLIAVVYDYDALALFIDAPDLLRQRDALREALLDIVEATESGASLKWYHGKFKSWIAILDD